MTSKIKNALNNIFEKSTEITNTEKENLFADVETITKKLRNGYYKSCDHVHSNQYHHQSKTNELFEFFQGYYERSKPWLEIFKQLPKEKINTVLDLCPGWSPKIEFALRDWHFDGKLYLLDADQRALTDLESFLDIVRVGYEVEKLCADFFTDKIKPVDLLVANHVIDDLLLGIHCDVHGLTKEQLYGSEKLFKETSKAVIAMNKQTRKDFTNHLLNRIQQMTNPGGFIAFMHYPGKLEKGLGLYDWIAFIYEIMEELCNKCSIVYKKTPSTPLFDDDSRFIFVGQKN